MAAVLQYVNNGKEFKRVWPEICHGRFNAVVKYYIQVQGQQLQTIEKPSKRPATFEECKLIAQKLINEHGNQLKQILIWNMDEMKRQYPDWVKNYA